MYKQVRVVDDLSAKTCMVHILSNGQRIGTATGFYITHNGSIYLVTNWHVLSGRRPFDNQPMNRMGALPDTIIATWLSNDLNDGGSMQLNLSDDAGEKLWIEHPHGSDVDVACIKVNRRDSISMQTLDYQSLSNTDMLPQIGMPAVVVGYPFGKGSAVANGHPLPIWKTGHLASEPAFEYDSKPAILLDVTGRSGMSGSPVFIRSSGPYKLASADTVEMRTGPVVKFIGIYSGRLMSQVGEDDERDSNLSSELGLVWRPSVIQELFS